MKLSGWKLTKARNLFPEFLAVILISTSATSVFSQSLPVDGPWSGQIQCQLNVQQKGYARSEIQTWKLTSNVPTNKGSDMKIYAATWSAIGQGAFERLIGQQNSLARWTINVPPTNAAIAMFIRGSDKQFIVHIWQRPAPSNTGIKAIRQTMGNGATQQLNSTVYEWILPVIALGPELTGKLSVPAESLGADLTPPGTKSTADCMWQFANKVSTIDEEQSLTNSRTLTDYSTSVQQSWTNQRETGATLSTTQNDQALQAIPATAASLDKSQMANLARSENLTTLANSPGTNQTSSQGDTAYHTSQPGAAPVQVASILKISDPGLSAWYSLYPRSTVGSWNSNYNWVQFIHPSSITATGTALSPDPYRTSSILVHLDPPTAGRYGMLLQLQCTGPAVHIQLTQSTDTQGHETSLGDWVEQTQSSTSRNFSIQKDTSLTPGGYHYFTWRFIYGGTGSQPSCKFVDFTVSGN